MLERKCRQLRNSKHADLRGASLLVATNREIAKGPLRVACLAFGHSRLQKCVPSRLVAFATSLSKGSATWPSGGPSGCLGSLVVCHCKQIQLGSADLLVRLISLQPPVWIGAGIFSRQLTGIGFSVGLFASPPRDVPTSPICPRPAVSSASFRALFGLVLSAKARESRKTLATTTFSHSCFDIDSRLLYVKSKVARAVPSRTSKKSERHKKKMRPRPVTKSHLL